MKNIFTILTIFFCTIIGNAQPNDARATIISNGLRADVYINAATPVVFSGAVIALNIAISLPTNGSTNPADAPTYSGATSILPNLAINSTIPVFIQNSRFVYTFILTGTTTASTWAANTDNLAFHLTFSAEANGDHPRLDNLLGSSQSYFYFEVAGATRSDTEGDPFYNGIEGTYPSSDVYVEATIALPVTLISFNAEKFQSRSSKITWSTSSEVNSSHFLVQRSTDRKEWTTLGKVNAAGESQIIRNYNFIDQNVYNGSDASFITYYRLISVDLDGQTKGSPIKSVVFGNSDIANNRQFLVYPNPASEGIHVEWTSISSQPTDIEFFDTNGKQVYTHKVGENSSQEYVDFTRSNMQAGLYLMRVMSGDEPVEFKQIVIGQR